MTNNMSGKTSETRCKHCSDLDSQFAHLKFANTGAWQYRNEHGHWVTCQTQRRVSKPTPPEREAAPEQPPKCGKCAAGIGHEWQSCERTPVVSTSAPEPRVLTAQDISNLGKGHHRCEANGCGCNCGRSYDEHWGGVISRYGRNAPQCKCKPVAPESYKPAEGANSCCHLDSRVNGNLQKRFKWCPWCGKNLLAATPVTVEAPEPEAWLKSQGMYFGHGEWHYSNGAQVDAGLPGILAHYRDAILATPKAIGDVEEVAREAVGVRYKLSVSASHEDVVKATAAILSPFFTPAPPKNKVTQQEIDETRINDQPPDLDWDKVHALLGPWQEVWRGDKNRYLGQYPEWMVNAAGELFAHDICDAWSWNDYVSAATVIMSRHFPPQPPCSECATLRKERDDLLAMFCERHIDTTLSDANVNDDCPLCNTESRAKAAEAQLSTLREVLGKKLNRALSDAKDLNKYVNEDDYPRTRLLKVAGHTTGMIIRLERELKEIAAPTPEVAPKEGKP